MRNIGNLATRIAKLAEQMADAETRGDFDTADELADELAELERELEDAEEDATTDKRQSRLV